MISEDSFLDFKCPYCSEPVSFPGDQAGLVQTCPLCNASLIVPAEGSPAGRAIPVPIRTPRLALRRLAPGDWKDLLGFMNDEQLFRFDEWVPLDEDAVLRWLDSDRHAQLTTPDHPYHLALELTEGEKLIGLAAFSFTQPQRQVSIGRFLVGREFQRQGLGLEALTGLLGFCFREINVHRASATCDARNVAGQRLLEKAGLRREGELVKNKFADGQWVNTLIYAILAEEFRR